MDDLARIEAYYDTVPRANATVENIGPFTLFIGHDGPVFYARPRLGVSGPWSESDVQDVLARQAELGLPQELEWVHDIHPSLSAVASAVGLRVQHVPLMVQRHVPRMFQPPQGFDVRILTSDDPSLAAARAAVGLGFGAPGGAIGAAGTVERDRAADGMQIPDSLRERLAAGLLVMAVAADESGPVAGGSHSPREDVTEITGVATLPAYRRRGLAAAVTTALADHAKLHGAGVCFLSAASDDVARMYLRLGFARVGTACLAAPAV